MPRPYAKTVETAPWKPDGFIAAKDIVTAVKLAGCLLACALPERWWPVAAGAMARVHLGLRSRSVHAMRQSSVVVQEHARALVANAIAADYLSNIQAIREILPGGWQRPLRLEKREALDEALARSRGAIVWASPFAGSDLAIKKALTLAGYALTHLSSPFHPFSPTRVGTALLNPIRLRAIDRYVDRRVLVVYGKARPALEILREVLSRNGIVEITATGAGAKSQTYPFLGGIIDLALGAPLLAFETGAALIPAFTLADGRHGYTVELGPDLRSAQASREDAIREMTARFVELLEPVVRAHPSQWESWFHPGTWRPK